jgi:hypothetical protein
VAKGLPQEMMEMVSKKNHANQGGLRANQNIQGILTAPAGFEAVQPDQRNTFPSRTIVSS